MYSGWCDCLASAGRLSALMGEHHFDNVTGINLIRWSRQRLAPAATWDGDERRDSVCVCVRVVP